ncbi:MAG: coenzyme F420-0:L-glutamate ligase [Clostridia bacterium]|nr:coenzyme F420-0:L-glutamate ligase [Clostridia bacterium]
MENKKSVEIRVNGQAYERLPIKTHVVMYGEQLEDVVKKYASEHLQEGDILFVSEKIVAITQGRAYPVKDIKPRKLAYLLSNKVTKTKAGIGLGMPETMEMALRECGTAKIIFAAGVSAVSKAFGRKGDFYRVAGYKASSIDGPTPNTIPPYNTYVVLGPDRPDEVAKVLSSVLGCQVAIVDINDIGGNTLGISHASMNRDEIVKILKDNPLGQCHESTPLGIIRKMPK